MLRKGHLFLIFLSKCFDFFRVKMALTVENPRDFFFPPKNADQFLDLNFCVNLGLGLLFLRMIIFCPQI